MLTKKSAFEHHCEPLRPHTVLQYPITSSDHFSHQFRMFTLNRSLRPSRRQQSHSPNHKILKRLVRRLAPFAHILGETRYLRRRVLIAIFEGGVELGCLFDFPRVTFEDVGFAAPLLGGSGD